jgi:ubiquinone/menaquinone biosynthesis C-methylase UbiE
MTNRDNHPFYDQMSAEALSSFAQQNGFIPARDIELILSRLGFVPSSVLEVGAGAGRVVDALLAKLRAGKIFALERSPILLEHLQDRFVTDDRVEIIAGDVSSIDLPEVDLTLWVWSGITDFGPEEQPVILSRLATRTRRTVVLEAPAEGAETIAGKVEGQWHSLTLPNGVEYRGYVPTTREVMDYARKAHLRLRDRVEYWSRPNRRRNLYFLDCPKE